MVDVTLVKVALVLKRSRMVPVEAKRLEVLRLVMVPVGAKRELETLR